MLNHSLGNKVGKAESLAVPRALDLHAFISLYPIGKTTFYKEIAEGRLRATKVGRRTLIDSRDAEDWWRGCRDASASNTASGESA